MPDNTRYTIDDALYLMARLRDPNDGCAWDLKQRYQDIVPYTIEECYELADAIAKGDMSHTEEELGDVLFQVIFLTQLGKEDGAFDFQSTVHVLVDKLVRRHPHVFPDGDLRQRFGSQSKAVEDIKNTWEAIKRQERAEKQQGGMLDDVPTALPALSRAQKLQKRVSNAGMDWRSVEAVFDVIDSEIKALKEAIAAGDSNYIAEQTGAVLFSVVTLARHLKQDAEDCLRQSNLKFTQRITAIEQACIDDNTPFNGISDDQFEALWQPVKQQLSP